MDAETRCILILVKEEGKSSCVGFFLGGCSRIFKSVVCFAFDNLKLSIYLLIHMYSRLTRAVILSCYEVKLLDHQHNGINAHLGYSKLK